MKRLVGWLGLVLLGGAACTSPAPSGDGAMTVQSPQVDPAQVFGGCRSQEKRLDVWCGDIVFVTYQQPQGKEDLQQTMASLRERIAEQPGTQLQREGPVAGQHLAVGDVLRIRYRYMWGGKEYVAQTFGRATSMGNVVADCAAPANQEDAIARCTKMALLGVTRPHAEIIQYFQPETGVVRPRPRFDDPGRTCRKREQPGIQAFACDDGSGFLTLDPKAGAPQARNLVTTLGSRGGTEDAGELGCEVRGMKARCHRYTCKGGPSGCEILVAPLGPETGAGEAICVIPPGTKELPSICKDTFTGFGAGQKPR